MRETDPRALPLNIGGVLYNAPSNYDCIPPEDFRVIYDMPCFFRAAANADAASGFAQLGLYAWDGQFHWVVDVKAFASRVWRNIIAVDDIELSYFGSVHEKRTRHVSDVAKGTLSLAGAPLIDGEIDVDLWLYRYYCERPYVANL